MAPKLGQYLDGVRVTRDDYPTEVFIVILKSKNWDESRKFATREEAETAADYLRIGVRAAQAEAGRVEAERLAAKAAAKALLPPTVTCQICARPILANTGVIAHHGYKRPGHGWQTSSCLGAKHLPYEQSCDFIPVVIERVAEYISQREAWYADFTANPPAEFKIYDTRYGQTLATFKLVTRPDDFDPKKIEYRYGCKYTSRFRELGYACGRDITGSQETLKFLKARLAAWVAPVAK